MTISMPIIQDSANSTPTGAVELTFNTYSNEEVEIGVGDRKVRVSKDEFLLAAGAIAGKGI